MATDTHGEIGQGWIGVDLDGTLAHYDTWRGAQHIGAPVPKMVNRVIGWINRGERVKIRTARVCPGKPDTEECRDAIQQWLGVHVYPRVSPRLDRSAPHLEITHEKDCMMIELWDDRCVQVIPNTGVRADGKD